MINDSLQNLNKDLNVQPKENKNDDNDCDQPIVLYYNTDIINTPSGVSVWQGIAQYKNKLLIVGTSQPSPTTGQGVLYFGDITCVGGETYTLSVPDALYSSVYGPRYNPTTELFTFVGSYTNSVEDENNLDIMYGFLFRGRLCELKDPRKYIYKMYFNPIKYPITFVHSTDGNFAVGNSGSNRDAESWLYNITTKTYTAIKFPNSFTTTTYGIIQNSPGSYTIVGGYSTTKPFSITDIYTKINNVHIPIPINYGYIADFTYNKKNGENNHFIKFSNFTTINYKNNILTHIQGIGKTGNPNIYSLGAGTLGTNNENSGFLLKMKRNNNNKFIQLKWNSLNYGRSIGETGLTSSNSVIGNDSVGIFISTETEQAIPIQAIPIQASIIV